MRAALDAAATAAMGHEVISELTFDSKTDVLHYHFKTVPPDLTKYLEQAAAELEKEEKS